MTCMVFFLILNNRRGPNKWRDQLLPDKILSERMNGKILQSGNGSSVGNEHQSDKLYKMIVSKIFSLPQC